MKLLNKFVERVSTKNRTKKMNIALEYLKDKNTSILDLGVDPTVNGNTNYFEKWFKGENKVTCMGRFGNFTEFKKMFPKYEVIEFDGFNFPPFKEKFDFVFCNAVIEHVGDRNTQIEWLKNVGNISKILFITTPNRNIPFEVHTRTFFIHWMPENLRRFFYKILKKTNESKDLWLLSKKDFKEILDKAGFKILRIVKNKFLFFTIDYAIIAEPKKS